jgi:hypothetical protein
MFQALRSKDEAPILAAKQVGDYADLEIIQTVVSAFSNRLAAMISPVTRCTGLVDAGISSGITFRAGLVDAGVSSSISRRAGLINAGISSSISSCTGLVDASITGV